MQRNFPGFRDPATESRVWLSLLTGCVLAVFVTGCQAELYTGKLKGTGRPALEKKAGAVLFSMIMRRIAYSNSNGLDWIARRDDDDYRHLYREITGIMEESLQMQPIPREEVLDHALYQEGRFPLGLRFFLNTARLPIIAGAEEEELMLRTARALGARYYVTVLADHSVSKIVARPASVTSVLVFNLYSAGSGLIYQAEHQVTESAEPYDRALSLGELYRGYEPIVEATLDRNMTYLLAELKAGLSAEIRFVEERPIVPADGEAGKTDDLGF
jgi:hypothetical protein